MFDSNVTGKSGRAQEKKNARTPISMKTSWSFFKEYLLAFEYRRFGVDKNDIIWCGSEAVFRLKSRRSYYFQNKFSCL